MTQTIEIVFKEMVDEIEKTKMDGFEPNRYHETASISEVNLVYHFAKQLEKKTNKCVVYLEFPCNSGRVDAVILYENNILLIEAKTKMDNKKYKILNAQTTRFENTKENLKLTEEEITEREEYLEKYFRDSSLRDIINDRVSQFIRKKWNITNNINIYGILLADALSEYQKDKWDYTTNPQHYIDCKLDCMREYTFFDCIADVNNENTIWYLGAIKQIDIIQNNGVKNA